MGKNFEQLQNTIDSINLRLDSIGVVNTELIVKQTMPSVSRNDFHQAANRTRTARGNSPGNAPAPEEVMPEKGVVISFDSLISSLTPSARSALLASAIRTTEQSRNAISFESEHILQEKKIVRRHGIELLKKFTLSIACLIFFFIGAPLGAIIRKGGIGMPLVISVLLFLFYYIIDNTGYKMARDGHTQVWFGMWLSTFILAPLGIFVTYKAMHDSAVFDPDRIRIFFRKLLRKREERGLTVKEVIINDVDPRIAYARISALQVKALLLERRLEGRRFFIGKALCAQAEDLAEALDSLIDYLHDIHDKRTVELLNRMPVVRPSRFMFARTLRHDLRIILAISTQLRQKF